MQLLLLSLMWLTTVSGQSTEGTFFAVSLPRTAGTFDCLVTMTAREETSYTIESSTETRQGTIPAMGSVTEVYPMEQRVTHGLETVGLIVTTDNPISVNLDQPSWEVDAGMARPIHADGTEFFVVSYLNEKTTPSLRPLSFYSVVASEDDTTVEILNNERRAKVVVTLDKFEVISEDASEYEDGSEFDYTGVYVRSDKPVSVYAGHGRVQFPDNTNNNYIYDSMPNTADLGTAHTTFPIIYGPDDSGYVLRVLAVTDGTTVSIFSLDVSEEINTGEFYELDHRVARDAIKIECSSPCYAAEFPIATALNGGEHDTSMGGSLIPLVPDRDFTDDLLVSRPYLSEGDVHYVAVAVIANSEDVEEVYINGQNIDDWVEKEGFSHAVINVDPDTEIFHIESLSSGTDIAAYVYTNRHGSAAGTKGYSAAHR